MRRLMPPVEAQSLLLRWSFAALRMTVALCVAASGVQAQSPRVLPIARDLKIDAADHDFTWIFALAVARDGSIGVWQTKDSKILFFDAKGLAAGSVGRKGEGPGEFRNLSAGMLGWLGDTLWAYDDGMRRVTLISPQHTFVRTFFPPEAARFQELGNGPSAAAYGPYMILPNRQMLMTLRFKATSSKPSWYMADEKRQPLVLVDATGLLQKFVAWEPPPSNPECTVRFTGATMNGAIGIPFCAEQLSARSSEGRGLARLIQSNAAGATGTYRVISVGTTGDTIFAHDYGYNAIAIPKKVIDDYIAIRAAPPPAGTRGGGYPPEAIATYKSMKYPVHYPPVRNMRIGQDGTLWIETENGLSDHSWQVLSAKGDVIGQIKLPPNVKLMVATRTAIWGTEKDADDLESVVRYKVGQ